VIITFTMSTDVGDNTKIVNGNSAVNSCSFYSAQTEIRNRDNASNEIVELLQQTCNL